MNFLSIAGIFDSLDFTKLVPKLDGFLGLMTFAIVLCLLLGPALLFYFGQQYLKNPEPLPNLKKGFRCYFGMGSKAAWAYTQKLAGKLWSISGMVLGAISVIACIVFFFLDGAQIALVALICLILQAVAAVGSWAAVSILAAVNYDKDGKLRK